MAKFRNNLKFFQETKDHFFVTLKNLTSLIQGSANSNQAKNYVHRCTCQLNTYNINYLRFITVYFITFLV